MGCINCQNSGVQRDETLVALGIRLLHRLQTLTPVVMLLAHLDVVFSVGLNLVSWLLLSLFSIHTTNSKTAKKQVENG